MNVHFEQMKKAFGSQELQLWELITVEARLRQQIQELEHALKHENPNETNIHSTQENVIFDFIAGEIREYEMKLWQLLDDKTILETELKILRNHSKLTVKTEKILAEAVFSNIKPPENECADDAVEIALVDIKPEIHLGDYQSPASSPDADRFDEWPAELGDGLQDSSSLDTTNKSSKCPHCDREYPSAVSLRQHMRVHLNSKTIPCRRCSQMFKSKCTLQDHMRIHHMGKGSYECNICEATFLQKSKFRYHIKKHKEAGQLYHHYKCPECDEMFDTLNALRKHSLMHTNGKPFECYLCHKRYAGIKMLRHHFICHSHHKSMDCPYCDRKFNNLQFINQHIKYTHKNDRQFLCNQCGKAFQKMSTLKNHLTVHTGERKYACLQCNKMFTQRHTLVEHMRLHNNDKLKCKICEKTYSTLSSYKRHTADKHIEEKPFACTICDKKFAVSYRLHSHMRNHTDRTFPCSDCKKSFRTKSLQMLHIRRVHMGEREIECEDCGERFFNQGGLRTHKLTHAGVREFGCNKCDKQFVTVYALKKHQLTHSDIRPFKCDQCTLSFKTLGNLQRHTNVHTNERPYSCEVCGARFADPGYIKIHMRVHTGEKPYACSVCDRRFMDQRNMKKHEKIHSK